MDADRGQRFELLAVPDEEFNDRHTVSPWMSAKPGWEDQPRTKQAVGPIAKGSIQQFRVIRQQSTGNIDRVCQRCRFWASTRTWAAVPNSVAVLCRVHSSEAGNSGRLKISHTVHVMPCRFFLVSLGNFRGENTRISSVCEDPLPGISKSGDEISKFFRNGIEIVY